MPDWTFSTTTSATSWDTWEPTPLTVVQIQYEEYRRECLRQDTSYEMQMQMHEQQYEQQMEEERQLTKDKERYPLFFWRETCVQGTLKEGIV